MRNSNKLLFAFIAILLLPFQATLKAETVTPNIVLIFIDDMGYADIGPFGNKDLRTPNLDKFAAEGRKFTSFYATPVCSMSRASMLTGCYNVRVSVPGVLFPKSKIGLNPDEVTLAEVVKPVGYATCAIGKWHLGHHQEFLPTKLGFDMYFGIPYSNDMTLDTSDAHFAKDCIFNDGMTEEKARQKAIGCKVPLVRGTEIIEYAVDQNTLTKRYTEEAVKFMREHKDGPFFVYLPHTMIHYPEAASEAFRGKSKLGLIGDAIEEIDWSVGQIMATLKELHLDEKTLVIFTSDNGPDRRPAPPFRGNKATTWEGGVREPCIMRWPGKIPAGTTCDQIAGNVDMLPTFAKLSGGVMPKDRVIDGGDITPLMFDANPAPVRDTQLYFASNGILSAIRQGQWKLFLTKSQGDKIPKSNTGEILDKVAEADVALTLYDLSNDLGESNEVTAAHPDIVAKLKTEAGARDVEIRKNKRPAGVYQSSYNRNGL